MPYMLVMASNEGSEILRGPTYFGDEDMDQGLLTELEGKPYDSSSDHSGKKKGKNVDEDPQGQMYITDKPPREVLDVLENAKYRFQSASGLGESIVWTMHKDLVKAPKSKKASNGTAGTQNNKPGTRANSKASDAASRESSVASNMEKLTVNGNTAKGGKKGAAQTAKKGPAGKKATVQEEDED